MINQDLLQKYSGAFIIYEIANHGVDPRETLDGTTLRIKSNEGYKYGVIQKWNELLHNGLSYSEAVIKLLPGVNLVDYRFPKEKLNTKEFEEAAAELYDVQDDAAAFRKNLQRIARQKNRPHVFKASSRSSVLRR